jgi:hypothetical protein
MARIKDRQRVVHLRKQGKTYSEIRRELNVPKSTLSDWLSNYPLNQEELRRLKATIKKNRDLAVERCRLTKQKKREARLRKLYKREKKRLLPLSKKGLFLSGLFLYWGEGVKGLKSSVSLNNTDPKVVKFYLFWLITVFMIPKSKIRVYVHLYSDMDVSKELHFWSRELKIPLSQFGRPYIKESKRADIDHKGFGHGTCALVINDVRLKEKIMMGIEAVADYYSEKV